jgi:hypothetical protein
LEKNFNIGENSNEHGIQTMMKCHDEKQLGDINGECPQKKSLPQMDFTYNGRHYQKQLRSIITRKFEIKMEFIH